MADTAGAVSAAYMLSVEKCNGETDSLGIRVGECNDEDKNGFLVLRDVVRGTDSNGEVGAAVCWSDGGCSGCVIRVFVISSLASSANNDTPPGIAGDCVGGCGGDGELISNPARSSSALPLGGAEAPGDSKPAKNGLFDVCSVLITACIIKVVER